MKITHVQRKETKGNGGKKTLVQFNEMKRKCEPTTTINHQMKQTKKQKLRTEKEFMQMDA